MIPEKSQERFGKKEQNSTCDSTQNQYTANSRKSRLVIVKGITDKSQQKIDVNELNC